MKVRLTVKVPLVTSCDIPHRAPGNSSMARQILADMFTNHFASQKFDVSFEKVVNKSTNLPPSQQKKATLARAGEKPLTRMTDALTLRVWTYSFTRRISDWTFEVHTFSSVQKVFPMWPSPMEVLGMRFAPEDPGKIQESESGNLMNKSHFAKDISKEHWGNVLNGLKKRF